MTVKSGAVTTGDNGSLVLLGQLGVERDHIIYLRVIPVEVGKLDVSVPIPLVFSKGLLEWRCLIPPGLSHPLQRWSSMAKKGRWRQCGVQNALKPQ